MMTMETSPPPRRRNDANLVADNFTHLGHVRSMVNHQGVSINVHSRLSLWNRFLDGWAYNHSYWLYWSDYWLGIDEIVGIAT